MCVRNAPLVLHECLSVSDHTDAGADVFGTLGMDADGVGVFVLLHRVSGV